MRRATIVAPLRVAVLVAVGLNPLVLLYAANGARHFIWISLLIVAVGALVAWFITADVRFVMISGLAFSVAALAGYSSVIWFVFAALMIGGILARLGADGIEVEGTVVGFASPVVYVVALWTAFNLLLLKDPFNWITQSSDSAGSGGLQDFTALEVARATGELVLYSAPIAIVVLPALFFTGLSRSNPLAMWLGVLLLVSVAIPPAAVLLQLTDSPMNMRNGLPILLISVIGAIWLARSSEGGSGLVVAALIVGLVASIPWTFNAMKTYEYQNLEVAFANAISTRQSQEGSRTLNGETIGIVSEQAMAEYIRSNIEDESSILTDNAQTYAVMLLTGRPEIFFDRVDKSDGPWQEAAKDPANHVDYLLLSTDGSDDLLSKLYPAAADGSDPAPPRGLPHRALRARRRADRIHTRSGFAPAAADQRRTAAMTTAQLSMIAPPPSVAAVLGALTDETRIGQVDFSTRLAPEPEIEPEPNLDGYDEVVVLGDSPEEADLAPEDSEHADAPDDDDLDDPEDLNDVEDQDADDTATTEVVTLVSVPDLVAHDTDVTEAVQPAPRSRRRAAKAAAAATTPAPAAVATAAPETPRNVVNEPVVPAPLQERIHEPARLRPFEEPAGHAATDERPPTVEEIARLVIERMHDAELAMMRHLDAIEVESARRSELLTAQAELDAELIRLSARREAHSIVTAARVRAGGEATVGAEERRLDELTESLSRFAEVVDELHPVGARAVAWGRTP